MGRIFSLIIAGCIVAMSISMLMGHMNGGKVRPDDVVNQKNVKQYDPVKDASLKLETVPNPKTNTSPELVQKDSEIDRFSQKPIYPENILPGIKDGELEKIVTKGDEDNQGHYGHEDKNIFVQEELKAKYSAEDGWELLNQAQENLAATDNILNM